MIAQRRILAGLGRLEGPHRLVPVAGAESLVAQAAQVRRRAGGDTRALGDSRETQRLLQRQIAAPEVQ